MLADLLGLGPLQPALLGGTNYAWGGARAGVDITIGPLTIPSVRSQVVQYLDSLTGGPVDSQALFILAGGGNDIIVARDSDLDGASGREVIIAAAEALVDAVRMLIERGAANIMVLFAPDMGTTPRYLDDEAATELSSMYNQELDVRLAALDRRVLRFDPSSLLSGGSFRIANKPCLSGTGLCDDLQPFELTSRISSAEISMRKIASLECSKML